MPTPSFLNHSTLIKPKPSLPHFSTSKYNKNNVTQIPFSLFFSSYTIHSSFMARLSCFLILFFVAFASVAPSLEARKLLNTEKNNEKVKVPSSFDRLVLSALPKGKVPPSSPSKKTHATLEDEKLFARHLASIDRILNSVPSPGVGN